MANKKDKEAEEKRNKRLEDAKKRANGNVIEEAETKQEANATDLEADDVPQEKAPEAEAEKFEVEELKTGGKNMTPPVSDTATDNPLTNEAVIREGRDYTGLKIEGTPPDSAPVPKFTKPSIKFDNNGKLVRQEDNEPEAETKKNSNSGNGGGNGNSQSGSKPKNDPDLFARSGDDELSAKPKIINTKGDGGDGKTARKRAKQLAALCVWIYEAVYGQISRWTQVDDNKIAKLAKRGLLDTRILTLTLTDGRTVKNIIDDYNMKVDDICTVEEEEKEDMLETLTAIFIEEGWGLSDKQYFFFKLLMKTITDTIELIELKSMFKTTMTTISQQYVSQYGAMPANEQPKSEYEKPKKEKPQQQPKPENKEESTAIVPEQVPAGQIKTRKHKTKTSEIPEAEIVPPETVDTDKVKEVIKEEEFSENE